MEFKFEEQWAEVLTILFLALGFVIAVLLQSALFTFLSVIIAGFLGARVYYMKRFSEPIFPFVLIIIGFLVGYLLGSFWASRLWVLVFFALSFALSYYLHVKGIFAIFKREDFIK